MIRNIKPTTIRHIISSILIYHLMKLEVPGLKLCEHIRRVIFSLNGLQSRLVGWTIPREHILLRSSVVLVDIPVSQFPAFCESDTFFDKISCKLYDSSIIFDVGPCDGDVDHYRING